MYTRVGIRDLRADLAAAIRRARSGDRTIITDRGRPVAELGPPAVDTTPSALDPLLHRGALIAPRRLGERRTPRPVAIWSGARLDRALRELRG